MAMPRELPLDLDYLDLVIVELANNRRRPVLIDEVKLLQQVDLLLHHRPLTPRRNTDHQRLPVRELPMLSDNAHPGNPTDHCSSRRYMDPLSGDSIHGAGLDCHRKPYPRFGSLRYRGVSYPAMQPRPTELS